MNTNLTQITKAYIGSSAFLVIAGEGAIWFLDRYHWVRQPDYLLPVAAAVAIPAGYLGLQLMARGMRLSQPPAKRGPVYQPPPTFASVVGWVVGNNNRGIPHTWGLEDTTQKMTSIKLPKEPKRDEFRFFEKGMTSEITETMFYQFCVTAWRRQQQVYYGNLAANRIFSRQYFTREARPRYPLQDYNSITYILDSRGLVRNRYKGGELLFVPTVTMEEAKRRWSVKP